MREHARCMCPRSTHTSPTLATMSSTSGSGSSSNDVALGFYYNEEDGLVHELWEESEMKDSISDFLFPLRVVGGAFGVDSTLLSDSWAGKAYLTAVRLVWLASNAWYMYYVTADAGFVSGESPLLRGVRHCTHFLILVLVMSVYVTGSLYVTRSSIEQALMALSPKKQLLQRLRWLSYAIMFTVVFAAFGNPYIFYGWAYYESPGLAEAFTENELALRRALYPLSSVITFGGVLYVTLSSWLHFGLLFLLVRRFSTLIEHTPFDYDVYMETHMQLKSAIHTANDEVRWLLIALTVPNTVLFFFLAAYILQAPVFVLYMYLHTVMVAAVFFGSLAVPAALVNLGQTGYADLFSEHFYDYLSPRHRSKKKSKRKSGTRPRHAKIHFRPYKPHKLARAAVPGSSSSSGSSSSTQQSSVIGGRGLTRHQLMVEASVFLEYLEASNSYIRLGGKRGTIVYLQRVISVVSTIGTVLFVLWQLGAGREA